MIGNHVPYITSRLQCCTEGVDTISYPAPRYRRHRDSKETGDKCVGAVASHSIVSPSPSLNMAVNSFQLLFHEGRNHLASSQMYSEGNRYLLLSAAVLKSRVQNAVPFLDAAGQPWKRPVEIASVGVSCYTCSPKSGAIVWAFVWALIVSRLDEPCQYLVSCELQGLRHTVDPSDLHLHRIPYLHCPLTLDLSGQLINGIQSFPRRRARTDSLISPREGDER